jgi:hypothetical protein
VPGPACVCRDPHGKAGPSGVSWLWYIYNCCYEAIGILDLRKGKLRSIVRNFSEVVLDFCLIIHENKFYFGLKRTLSA